MSLLYFGLNIFCRMKLKSRIRRCVKYTVYFVRGGGGCVSNSRMSNRQNTASPKYNDDISLLISQYLTSEAGPWYCAFLCSNPCRNCQFAKSWGGAGFDPRGDIHQQYANKVRELYRCTITCTAGWGAGVAGGMPASPPPPNPYSALHSTVHLWTFHELCSRTIGEYRLRTAALQAGTLQSIHTVHRYYYKGCQYIITNVDICIFSHW